MKKKKHFINKINHTTWTILGILLSILLWKLISMTESGGIVFAPPEKIVVAIINNIKNGDLLHNTYVSLKRVIEGFCLAFVFAIPIAILMGWYKIFCSLVEPLIQFIRNIPPIAYIPLIIVGFGVREKSKIAVIFIAAFLTIVVTVYQGVKNIDPTLVKAARILGANNTTVFFKVVIPSSLPYIITATYLGLGSSMTALVAAEMTGASSGLGVMIQTSSQYFQMDIVLMGILIIGLLGMLLMNIVKLLEKHLTKWQDKREG